MSTVIDQARSVNQTRLIKGSGFTDRRTYLLRDSRRCYDGLWHTCPFRIRHSSGASNDRPRSLLPSRTMQSFSSLLAPLLLLLGNSCGINRDHSNVSLRNARSIRRVRADRADRYRPRRGSTIEAWSRFRVHCARGSSEGNEIAKWSDRPVSLSLSLSLSLSPSCPLSISVWRARSFRWFFPRAASTTLRGNLFPRFSIGRVFLVGGFRPPTARGTCRARREEEAEEERRDEPGFRNWAQIFERRDRWTTGRLTCRCRTARMAP